MTRLVFELLRPYRARLAIVFVAMLVEIGTSLAAPWPLKLVIDDALGNHHLPHWLDWAHQYGGFGKHTLGVALFAGVATLTIAVVGAISSYIDNYYTTSVGQWVANDLRLRVYEHLHRLSLRYYDHAKIGALVSTITTDVTTIQNFASSSTLDIVIDLITIVFMVGLMFWLDWDFTLIAVAFTPVLLIFVFHFKKAMKEATRAVRVKQSDVLSIVQHGLGSIRVTKAFGRQDIEMAHLESASHATVAAALRARQIKSLMSPVVSVVVAICTAIVLWKGTSLIVAGTMTAGALTVYLAYLKQFFKPVKGLVRHRAGTGGRYSGPHGVRQIHRAKPAAAFLRSVVRACADRRHRYRRLQAGFTAVADRLRAAGHDAVPRHHPGQHRLWPAGGER
jgi:ABC-type multidrug transport system fused ATPase/permease subunit